MTNPTVHTEQPAAELIGHVISEHLDLTADASTGAWRYICDCGKVMDTGDRDEAEELHFAHQGEAVLAVLAGRLLPDGGTKHADHGVVYEGVELHVCADRSACIQFFPHVHAHERTVTTWPDGTVLSGPWRQVESEVLGEALNAAFRRSRP